MGSAGSFCQIYRVTDEALIAETAVWPNFFLMNVLFAFEGSTLLTSSFGNHVFACHLVLKHLHANMILSVFCIP